MAAEAAAEVALSLIELSVLDSHVFVPEEVVPDEAAAVLNCNGKMGCLIHLRPVSVQKHCESRVGRENHATSYKERCS